MAAQPKLLDASAIQNEQKALQLLCDEMQQAKDDETREALAEQIKLMAANLEKMCAELQAEADLIAPPDTDDVNIKAVVEVVLTPEQRKRVLETTGIDVPSVRISDPNATLTKNMKHIQPEFIEECAIEQAEHFKSMLADYEDA